LKRRSWITLAVLTVAFVALIALLLAEAASGPTFRAEDHADFQACVAGIPQEWRRGSLEYIQAEAACGYVHMPR
jgi:hypothetical protein